LLRVGVADEAAARAQLQAYESESRAARMPVARVQAPLFPGAWIAASCTSSSCTAWHWACQRAGWRVDAFQRGELDGALVQGGQGWRAWTALTLHWDGPHLVANLGAGVWFGYLAARQLGAGTAWLLTVTGAAAANLFDAHFGPPSYRSVGASTAVFTALGLIAAHSWRTRYHLPQRWALRWAPLIAGLVLLGWFGHPERVRTSSRMRSDSSPGACSVRSPRFALLRSSCSACHSGWRELRRGLAGDRLGLRPGPLNAPSGAHRERPDGCCPVSTVCLERRCGVPDRCGFRLQRQQSRELVRRTGLVAPLPEKLGELAAAALGTFQRL